MTAPNAFGRLLLLCVTLLLIVAHSSIDDGSNSTMEDNDLKPGDAYGLISRIQTECELEALMVGTILADRFNSFDESTEWDTRLHNDYLVENLGFANWTQDGLSHQKGKTPHHNDASALHKHGGWAGHIVVNTSSYWALENQWLYLMGDSTQRQLWTAMVLPFSVNVFGGDAKKWTRENCDRQFPHRREHVYHGHFPEEGWGGLCGMNEVTCDFPGFGAKGKLTFDWKHFAYEDYDEWLFGVHAETGKWSNDKSIRRPDVLAIEVGLHTCFHAISAHSINETTIKRHEADIPILMHVVKNAIERHATDSGINTIVIISTASRPKYNDLRYSQCTWRYNRLLVHEAHRHGFAVLEREEIERRLLYRSEYYPPVNKNLRPVRPDMHLDKPSPEIVGTSLLALISCLRKNETAASRGKASSYFTMTEKPPKQ